MDSKQKQEDDLLKMWLDILYKLAKWPNVTHKNSDVWWDIKTLILYPFKWKKHGP